MIVVGTKLVSKPAITKYGLKENAKFVVTEVIDNVIKLRSEFGYGVCSIDEIYTFFEEDKTRRTWCDWEYVDAGDNDYGVAYYVRNNGKTTEVKLGSIFNIEAKATCSPNDTFNKQTGELLALCRAIGKLQVKIALKVLDTGCYD